MNLPPDQIARLVSQGAVLGPQQWSEPARKPREPAPLVTGGVAVVQGMFVAVVPVQTASETNMRSWRARSKRSNGAWKAVSQTVGKHLDLLAPFALAYHAGHVLKVTFVRLGGRRLDGMANLGAALKGVEDATAFMLGASDGDPRWMATAAQEPGGPAGVRIEIEIA